MGKRSKLTMLKPNLTTLNSECAKPMSHAVNYGRCYGGGWKRLRDLVMKRDRFLCQPCYRTGRVTRAEQVDHIIPQAEGGTDKMENCQAICLDCHSGKSREEQKRGIARMRSRE